MTMPLADALHPVREALLARARADARARLAEADQDADSSLAAVREQAENGVAG